MVGGKLSRDGTVSVNGGPGVILLWQLAVAEVELVEVYTIAKTRAPAVSTSPMPGVKQESGKYKFSSRIDDLANGAEERTWRGAALQVDSRCGNRSLGVWMRE